MKITRYLQVAVLAGAVLTTNCNKDDDQTSSSNADVVKFSFNAGDASKRLTRSNPLATDDSQTEFNANDKIQVTTDGQDPVTYVLGSDGIWTEEAGYLVWKANTQTFTAVYPSTATDPFTVPTDQSTEEKIVAADYMTVTSTCTRPTPGTDISLTLDRKTARVIVKIAGFNNQYSTAEQQVVSDVLINGITPYPQDLNADGKGVVNTTYTALVNPASAAATADFITLKDFDGKALKVIGIPEFVEGKSYTYELTVGKDEIKVGTVTVTDWNTGTIEGGRALADDEESVVGVSGEEILVSNGVGEGDHIGIKIGRHPADCRHGEILYDGYQGEPLTIFAQSNEKITKVEVTARGGGDKLTTTEGTASFSNGVFSITDINTSSIDLSLIAENDMVVITQIKVYYTGAHEVKPNSTVDLSTITSHVTIPNGCILTGTLSGYRRITIAEGANVTLEDVTINGDPGNDTYQWAGINCKGNNTITLSGTNTVKGFSYEWPGIFIAAGATLTIDGSGSLDVSGGANSAGIGSNRIYNSGGCGNIIINNGIIIARGGAGSPGIGATQGSSCGDITINGGTITSTRGDKYSADLGCGYSSTCGNITKNGGTVTAENVGVGYNGTCGTVSGF